MNIVCVPYHDWRKILREGFRTRDSHVIECLTGRSDVDKILIINRPYSFLEYVIKMKFKNIDGEVVYERGGGRLVCISKNVFIVDYQYRCSVLQLFEGRKWFIKKYKDQRFHNFIRESIDFLGMQKDLYAINFNVLASGINEISDFKKVIFDAWDNFAKFPNLWTMVGEIENCYFEHASSAHLWTTNAKSNIRDYSVKYKINNIKLISNGVSSKYFRNKISPTRVLGNILPPLIGFGGKFSHLLDVNLINFILETNCDLNFVFFGQKLDKKVFSAIKKTGNFYYLGDLYYDEYMNLVNEFDVCILPYCIKEKQTGSNPIKFYEYLAARKQVVSTRVNGIEDFSNYVFIADSYEDFSAALRQAIVNPKGPIDEESLHNYSWEFLSEEFIQLLRSK